MVNKRTGRIIIDEERCKGCGLCIWACPKGHVKLAKQENSKGIRIVCFDEAKDCTGCAFCAIICPYVGIEVYRDSQGKGKEVRGLRRKEKCQSSKSQWNSGIMELWNDGINAKIQITNNQ